MKVFFYLIIIGTPPGYSYSAGLTRGSVFPGGAYSAGLTRGSVFPGGAYSAGLTGGSVLQGGAYSAGLPGGAVLQGGAYSAGLPGGAVFPVAGGGAGPYTGITHGGSLPGGYVLPGAGAAGLNAYSSGSLYTTGMPGSAFPTGGAGHVGNVVNFGGVSVGSGWPYTYSGGNFGAGRVGNVINLGGQGYAPALTAGSYGTGLSYANRYTGSLGAYRPVGLGSYGMVPQSVYGASGYSQIPSGLAGFPLGLAGTGSYGRVGSSNYGGPTFGTSGNAFGGGKYIYSLTCVTQPYKARNIFGFSNKWLLI